MLTLLCHRSLDWLERSLDGDGRKIYTHAEADPAAWAE
jgi:hypothetical protein